MASSDHFFDATEFVLVYHTSIRVLKIRFQPFIELKILRKNFFFHMPYGIFILKKLSTLDTCYFKAAGAIDPEPKQMKY